MDLVGRLKCYIEHVGLQISQFADIAQIPRPTLSQILSGRNRKISNELMEKLHTAFPRLNISWLLFGDGEMEINSIPQIRTPQDNNQNISPSNDTHTSNISQISAQRPESTSTIVDKTSVESNHPTEYLSDRNNNEQYNHEDVDNKSKMVAPVSFNTDSSKKIQNIMVFYTDNSFEIFRPANS